MIWLVNNLFYTVSDHANLLKRISIEFAADGLIFKGLANQLPIISSYSTLILGRKPLKIRPLTALGGISFKISSFEERHDLQSIFSIPILMNDIKFLAK